MSKKLTFLAAAIFISPYLSGCSAIRSQVFNPAPQKAALTAMEYNFIHPRRSDLSSKVSTRLDQAGNTSDRLNYYSASGHRCRILSLPTSSSACKVNGTWKALAPILIPKQP